MLRLWSSWYIVVLVTQLTLNRPCRSNSTSKENGQVPRRWRPFRRRNHDQQRPSSNDFGGTVVDLSCLFDVDVLLFQLVSGLMKLSLTPHTLQKSRGLIDMGANMLCTAMISRLMPTARTVMKVSRKQEDFLSAKEQME